MCACMFVCVCVCVSIIVIIMKYMMLSWCLCRHASTKFIRIVSSRWYFVGVHCYVCVCVGGWGAVGVVSQ